MEFCPLAAERALPCARENLIATYAGLAGALPDTDLELTECFLRAKSIRPYSFCNMAVGFQGTQAQAEMAALEMRRCCTGNSSFRAFSLEGDAPHFRRAFLDAGLTCAHRLNWLLLDPEPEHAEAPSWQHAELPEDRKLVADFIVEGFFGNHPRAFKAAVHETTWKNPFELRLVGPIHKPDAACMLVRTPHCIGVFNVLVATNRRGRGLGRSLIRQAASFAMAHKSVLSLQCDFALVDWYRSLGFSQVGTVESFTVVT